MKKIIAMLLCLVMMPCLTAAAEEPAFLTADEVLSCCGALLAEALERGPVPAMPAEEGGYAFDYGDFVLYTPDQTLTADSDITAADLHAACDARGISAGSSLDALLAAYPLDNESLRGTYEEAVLYIGGILPETVNAGHALRNGSHVLVLEHTVYETDGGQVRIASVVYTLEANCVVAVQLRPAMAQMSLEEAQAQIDVLAALQEQDEYSMYREAEPDVLTREDLTFGPIDFVSASAEDMTALLGPAESDTWEQDGADLLRVMQWEGVQAIFHYDGQRRNPSLQLLKVYGDQLEGPRGVRVDDTMDSVLARFPHEDEAGVLYGDGEHAPYGRCDISADGAYVVYAAEVEGGSVLLALTIQLDRVAYITCSY